MEKQINVAKGEMLREERTLYFIHNRPHGSTNKNFDCNQFYAWVQPDYRGDVTKEQAEVLASEIQHRYNNYSKLEETNARLLEALKSIANWQLPETNEFWDTKQKQSMSYEELYGSNGVRDYIKSVAKNAIAEAEDNK